MLRIIFLPSLVLLVAGAVNIDPRCLHYSQGMKAQVLPNLLDCRKFVICDMGGNGQVLSCPKGLYFDVAQHACSFDSASCTHGELTSDTNHVQPPASPQAPVQSQPFPVPPQPVPVQPQPLPVQPQPFPLDPRPLPVQPQPQVPSPVRPPNLFPPVIKPDSDGMESTPSEIKNVPMIAPSITEAPIREQQQQQSDVEKFHLQSVCWDQSAGKVYPVADDCGLYVVCMGNSNAIVQRCPKGLLYDGKQQRCDFAEATSCATPRTDGDVVLDIHGVDMSLRVEENPHPLGAPVMPVDEIDHLPEVLFVPEPEVQPVVEHNYRIIDNHPRCLARENLGLTVELPHPTDCTRYLVCVGRVAIEKQCPPGQHWSTKHNWCDFASAAGCAL